MPPWAVWEAALAFVVRETGFDEMELFGQRRQAHLVKARALLVWILKTYTPGGLSYPEIARLMGGRDHTSIMYHWRKKIPQLLERDTGFRTLAAKFAEQASHRKETRHGDSRH